MTAIVREAHAKLNVFLRVLARRDDGYHEIETLILPISLRDVVTVEPADELTLDVVGPRADGVPTGQDNLVLRAARALAAEAGGGGARGARITIEKHVPVAAGLGGGSADAAAALSALEELWGTSVGGQARARAGLAAGSDVPALLDGGPVAVRGRGEIVDPVILPSSTWVVATFDAKVAAADAYAWWDATPATGSDPGALVAAAEAGDDELLGSALFNDLEPGVAVRHPEILEVREALVAAGAFGAVMSGSGPTVAALSSFAIAPTVAASVPGAVVVEAPPERSSPARIAGDGPSGVV